VTLPVRLDHEQCPSLDPVSAVHPSADEVYQQLVVARQTALGLFDLDWEPGLSRSRSHFNTLERLSK
jgi:hypothetical protein